jgi:hypothetical protein
LYNPCSRAAADFLIKQVCGFLAGTQIFQGFPSASEVFLRMLFLYSFLIMRRTLIIRQRTRQERRLDISGWNTETTCCFMGEIQNKLKKNEDDIKKFLNALLMKKRMKNIQKIKFIVSIKRVR